jgi:hypothetical protein
MIEIIIAYLTIGIVMQKILDGKITIDFDLIKFAIVWPYFFWEMIK